MKDVSLQIALLGNGLNGACYALAQGKNKAVFAGGAFTEADGVSAIRVAEWDGSQWSALGEGVDNDCKAIALNAQGDVYVGGAFLKAGDVVANRIAKWDGESWEALGTGLPSVCNTIAIDNRGNVYAGGQFTQIDNLTVNYVAKWDPRNEVWTALDTGLSDECFTLVFDAEDNLYAGGKFGVRKWDDVTEVWTSVGSFTGSTTCFALAIDDSATPKIIYAGGDFGVKQWVDPNLGWLSLPKITNDYDIVGNCNALILDKDANLYITGDFKIASDQACVRYYTGKDYFEQFGERDDIKFDSNVGIGYAACLDSQGQPFFGGIFPSAYGNAIKLAFTKERAAKILLDSVKLDPSRVKENGDPKEDSMIFIQNRASNKCMIEVYRGGTHIGNIQSPSEYEWAIPIRKGESISFKLSGSSTNNVVSPAYLGITEDSQNYKREVIDIVTPYSSSNAKYSDLNDISASECSFDIYKIPPARIDLPKNQGGGIRDQIFKSLEEGDTEYTVQNDVPPKPHFRLSNVSESKGTQDTSSVYGAQNFKKSLAANIEAAIPIEAIGIEAKYGFSTSVESSISKEEVFTLSRVDGTEYKIDLVDKKIALTESFVDDVVALPVPASLYTSLDEAKADKGWKNYRDTFIGKWGTHYPTQVIYGGYFWGIRTTNLQQVIKSKTFAQDAQASIDAAQIAKIGGGISTSTTSGTDSKIGKEHVFFEQRGGSGNSFDNWSSVKDNACPVGISLSSLENLLTDPNFKSKVTTSDLAKKKELLKWALQDYADSKPKYESTAPGLEIYEITPQSFVFKSADDDGWVGLFAPKDDVVEVFGKINIKAGKYDSVKKEIVPEDINTDLITIWDVPASNKISFHSKNDVPKSMTLQATNPLRYCLKSDPAAGPINRNGYGFSIEVEKVWEHDNVGTDEVFTNKTGVKKFDEVTELKSDFIFPLKFENWEIVISAKVQRLPLSTIGLAE